MTTATNPETGERFLLQGEQWVPIEKSATYEDGRKSYLVGGKWIDDSPAKERSGNEELVRQVGLTARAGIKSMTGPGELVGNAIFGLAGQPGRTTQAVDSMLKMLGFPEPETETERVSGAVASALSGTGITTAAGRFAQPVTDVGRRIAEQFASRPALQASAATAGSGTGALIGEAGGDPLLQMAGGLLAGVAVPMGAQFAAQFPARALAQSITQAERRPFAAEGNRLATETGIDLPLGARTGSRFMLTMENAARKYPMTADRAQDVDVKLANQAVTRVNQLADAISTKRGDTEHLGRGIQLTVQRAAEKLGQVRDEQATADYGAVRRIAGDQPVIKFDNFAATLREIVDEYANVAGADAQKVVAQANAALRKAYGVVEKGTADRTIETPTGKTIKLYGTPDTKDSLTQTIDEAMRTRRFYGSAARGSANVFEDIAPDLQRRLSARLFGAINQDFSASAANSSGALKTAFDKANARYTNNSASIEYLEKSALGRLVGEDLVDAAVSARTVNTVSGEAVMKKIAGMDPSTRTTSMKIIEQWNPELGQSLRANVLRSALETAAAIPPSVKGASEVPISFNRFVSALMGDKKTSFGKQLESYGFTSKEIADIKDTASAMMRAGDTTGMNYSNTGTFQEAIEIGGTLASAAKASTGSVMHGLQTLGSGVMSIAGKRIGMNRIVDAMASEEGRKALRTVASPRASPAAVISAFETIEGKEDN